MLLQSTFTANKAQLLGGAVASDGSANITNCIFNDNMSGGAGSLDAISGGGALATARSALLQGCTFTRNSVIASAGVAVGGAMYSAGTSDVTISNSTFNDSTVTLSGGALHINLKSSAKFMVKDTIFAHNKAFAGGAVDFASSGQMIAENCSFVNNTASEGSGAAVSTDDDTIFTKVRLHTLL
jgi:Right handed beta helix region